MRKFLVAYTYFRAGGIAGMGNATVPLSEGEKFTAEKARMLERDIASRYSATKAVITFFSELEVEG